MYSSLAMLNRLLNGFQQMCRNIPAHCLCEGMRMVTYDRLFQDYLPDTILVRSG